MGQSLVKNYVHVVFATKGRKSFISSDIANKLYPYLNGICNNMNCYPQLIGGHVNHVHILCHLSKNVALSKFIEQLKSSSSRWLKAQEELMDFSWQNGYSAFSVNNRGLNNVREYIANQHVHHRRLTYEEELRSLLIENELPFDERFLWD
ncbi:MAG: IS200/IS605 family transposase [Chryseolinea sp.]